jgi:hypothetical protein
MESIETEAASGLEDVFMDVCEVGVGLALAPGGLADRNISLWLDL